MSIPENKNSNESPAPGIHRLPRVPGPQRDFGGLPVTMRSEKGWQTNLQRAEKDRPVEGHVSSRQGPGPKIKIEPTPRKVAVILIKGKQRPE